MPQTKEERNKARSDARYHRNHNRYNERKQQIISLWLRAKKEKMTHGAILDYRDKWILSKNHDLPGYLLSQLQGVWDACDALAHRNDLVHCYPHPETGVVMDGKTICDQGLASQLSAKGLDKQGGFYWRNDDGTFTHPYYPHGS